jgi:hypothetical protein
MRSVGEAKYTYGELLLAKVRNSKLIHPMKNIFIILLLLVTACGRKTDPKAPEDIAPAPVTFLTADVFEGKVLLRWRLPDNSDSEDRSGSATFLVERREVIAGKPSERTILQELEKSPDPKVIDYSFTDKTPSKGSIYDYKVLPVTGEGIEGLAPYVVRIRYVGEKSEVEYFPE